MKMNRALYLGYYIKELDIQKFRLFLNYTVQKTGRSRAAILSDMLRSIFRYNISILEYFQFRFFEINEQEKNKWAGTGHMYEYQLQMNPKDNRQILNDKTLFYKRYGNFFIHKVADLTDLKNNPEIADAILSNPSGKMVFKVADGQCGEQVEICDCKDFDRQRMIAFMENSNYQLVEEFLVQHPELNRLSPSGVNTVRIITQLDPEGEVHILGCRLRISVNSSVDNLAAGNIAAPVNEATGQLKGTAVYSDMTKPRLTHHPVTNAKIEGFQIPFWKETLALAQKAARLHPQNRSVGWDIVITDQGPGLIEGNHDWCKLLWQLPVKKGLKEKLAH